MPKGSNWFGDELGRHYHDAVARGLTRGIAILDEEAVRLITQGPKTGQIYTTFFFTIGEGANRIVVPYGTRPPHQASAPGEAPASDTGFLVNNRSIKVDTLTLRASLTFHAEYALYLEFGTDRMEPRPFARPALANSWPRIVEVIFEELHGGPGA